jgi:glycosyltransferase involved in cell wall biosynthesis
MRVAVVTSSPPFSEGGHLVIARELIGALRAAGHTGDLILTAQNRFGRQASAYLSNWLTDVGATHDGSRIDRVISLRYPSYAVRHPWHVCWLNHTMREYYDLWDRFSATLSPKGRLKEGVRRRLIHAADKYLLTRNVRRVFAQSRTVQARLQRWGRIPSDVLYPPAPRRDYRCDEHGDYIFAVSRLTPLKRIDLIVEALSRPAARHIRCVIGGEGEEDAALRALVAKYSLEDRVVLPGRLSERELLDHLAQCRAVCFPPLGEDYGLVAIEAFSSWKPIITCTDSGGPAELAEGRGLIVDPSPDALAGAMQRVMDDRPLAEQLGSAAHAFAAGLTWHNTIGRLITD